MSKIPINLFMYNGHGMSIPDNFQYKGIKIKNKVNLKKNQFVVMNMDATDTTGASWLQTKIWKLLEATSPTEFAEFATQLKENQHSASIFGFYGSHDKDVECPNISVSDVPHEEVPLGTTPEIKKLYDKTIYPRFGLFSFPQESFIGKSRIMSDMKAQIDTKRKEIYNKIKQISGLYHYEVPLREIPVPLSTYIDEETSKVVINNEDLKILEQKPDILWQRNLIKTHPFTLRMNYLSDFIEAIGNEPFIIICNVCRSCDCDGGYTYNESNKLKATNINFLPKLINESYIFNDMALFLQPPAIHIPPINIVAFECTLKPSLRVDAPTFVMPQPRPQPQPQRKGIVIRDPHTREEIDPQTLNKNKYLKYKAKYLGLKAKLEL